MSGSEDWMLDRLSKFCGWISEREGQTKENLGRVCWAGPASAGFEEGVGTGQHRIGWSGGV